MITTIQIHEKVKKELDNMKEDPRDSYEDVILNLMLVVEKQKRSQKELLIKGYSEMAKDSLSLVKEWWGADLDWD